MKWIKKQPQDEELANGITHALGIVMGIVATIWLLVISWPTADGWRIGSTLIYTLTLTLMYTTSTLYHLWKQPSQRALLRRLDHSAIYLLIAGTYTPFTLITLRQVGYYGWGLFALVWLAAAIGIAITFYKMQRMSIVKTLCYIAMGMMVVLAYNPLVSTLRAAANMEPLYYLAIGGGFYIIGTIFYTLSDYRYMHPLWHLFVLAGSLFHLLAVAHL